MILDPLRVWESRIRRDISAVKQKAMLASFLFGRRLVYCRHMFSWRARRYLIVFLILGTLAGGAGFFAVRRLLPAPTCSDAKQNQGEHGIDCGGPCEPCELKNPKPLTVFWIKGIPAGENLYDAAAQVRNENELLASERLEYEFTLFDEFGPVARRGGSTFVLPQETFILAETGLSTTRLPVRAEFRVTNVVWEVRRDVPPALVVERREYRVEERAGKKQSLVEAVIANRSPLDLARVEVRVALFDQEGSIAGVNRLLLEDIPAGGRASVLSIWPFEIPARIGSTEVQPRVNILDPTVIVRPQ